MKYNEKAIEKFLDYVEDQGIFKKCCPSQIGLDQFAVGKCLNESNCRDCWRQALMSEPEGEAE